MKLSVIIKRIQSICGRYAQTQGTDASNELLVSLNDSIQSVCHKFQPDAFVNVINFSMQYDCSSDVFVARKYVSEEAVKLKNILSTMKPIDIAKKYPSFTAEETEWRVSALIQSSSDGNGYGACGYGISPYNGLIWSSNGYCITYDEAYFNNFIGNNVALVQESSFARQIRIKNEFMQSKHVRCVILENGNVISDVTFEPYQIKQSINNNRITHVLDLERKELYIYTNSIGNYTARIFSVRYPIGSRLLLIKKDKLFCSSNIQPNNPFYTEQYNTDVSLLATFIPPVLISEDQDIPKKIYQDKDLMNLIVYDASFSYSNLFGMPDEAIAKQLDQALDTYSSVKLQDTSGGFYGTITRMY
ncbi:MAG: hypothetical protein ACRCX2_22265 [Paraclostridium sp.]